MTEEQAIAIGTELAACAHFRWLPGMLARAVDAPLLPASSRVIAQNWRSNRHIPDVRDPATIGCLVQLMREAVHDPGASVVTQSFTSERGYRFCVVGGHHHGSSFMAMSGESHDTEGHALLAALRWAEGAMVRGARHGGAP